MEGQREFWTFPLHLRLSDTSWGVPFGIATATLLASDVSIKNALPQSASTIKRFDTLSNYGAFAMGGMVGGTYLLGHIRHNQYLSDTAWLAGEAGANSFLATYALKSLLGRQRPDEGNGQGDFFSHGQSFPSEHAAAAWSVARVFADRYPSKLTKFFLYGGAATITASRVLAQRHFASDAFVGTALGWYFGHQAVRRYDREHSDLSQWGTFVRSRDVEKLRAENMASPYVPLDSWIYPVMDRLEALGAIAAAPLGQRPWTRLQCAKLVLDAIGDRDMSDGSQASNLLASLQREFSWDYDQFETQSNVGAHVQNLYSRITQISGTPLNDSYHFGQTIINDFGRPYAQGLNTISGFQASANAGRLTFYVSGEYQHAPSTPAYSDAVRQVVANADVNSIQPATHFGDVNRF
ncbi:MAG: phosphatase PAP2 family protein, partial [Terriglobales bacterium]